MNFKSNEMLENRKRLVFYLGCRRGPNSISPCHNEIFLSSGVTSTCFFFEATRSIIIQYMKREIEVLLTTTTNQE
jgi:hypothetical protein